MSDRPAALDGVEVTVDIAGARRVEDTEGVAVSLGDGVPERDRPLGITVLAVVAAIGCVGGLAVMLVAMGGGGVVRGGALAFVVLPVVIALAGVAAYGLWTMRWWAWPLALLSWIAAGAQALIGLTSGMLSTDLVVAPIAIVYLLQHDVRSVFGPRVMAPHRRFVALTAILALVLALLQIGGGAAAGWSPTVPNDAGTTLVAQIDVAPLASTVAGSAGQEEAARVDSECLDRDQRPSGWLDLCWSVTRLPDADSAGDYYRFEAGGTFGSVATDPGQTAGSGVRWVVLRSLLLTPVVDGVSSVQPDGVWEGCPADDMGLSTVGARGPQLPCDGRTVASSDLQTHTVTWTCVGCLLLESPERAIGLSEDVKVAEGATPAWRLYADFGN